MCVGGSLCSSLFLYMSDFSIMKRKAEGKEEGSSMYNCDISMNQGAQSHRHICTETVWEDVHKNMDCGFPDGAIDYSIFFIRLLCFQCRRGDNPVMRRKTLDYHLH